MSSLFTNLYFKKRFRQSGRVTFWRCTFFHWSNMTGLCLTTLCQVFQLLRHDIVEVAVGDEGWSSIRFLCSQLEHSPRFGSFMKFRSVHIYPLTLIFEFFLETSARTSSNSFCDPEWLSWHAGNGSEGAKSRSGICNRREQHWVGLKKFEEQCQAKGIGSAAKDSTNGPQP